MQEAFGNHHNKKIKLKIKIIQPNIKKKSIEITLTSKCHPIPHLSDVFEFICEEESLEWDGENVRFWVFFIKKIEEDERAIGYYIWY